MELGFRSGEPILDCPPLSPAANALAEPLHRVDLAFVAPGDVLLQTTRPPLDDAQQGGRKQVRRSFTDLEDKLACVWRRYFAHCSRQQVLLDRRLHALLAAPWDDRRQITFRESEGAPYRSLNNCVGSGARGTIAAEERRSAVFFLRLEEAWPGGPGLIAAFGMDGTTTSVWGYRLGRDLAHLLREPGFVMAEITNGGRPERPVDLRWANDWPIEVLLHERVLPQDASLKRAGA